MSIRNSCSTDTDLIRITVTVRWADGNEYHYLGACERVRPIVIKARFLKEERGFTLSEMMVTIVIMMVVFFALYSVFDMSVRIFSFGSNKVEAVESARLGLERMEREIRAAYPVALRPATCSSAPTVRLPTRRRRCHRKPRSPSATSSVPKVRGTGRSSAARPLANT